MKTLSCASCGRPADFLRIRGYPTPLCINCGTDEERAQLTQSRRGERVSEIVKNHEIIPADLREPFEKARGAVLICGNCGKTAGGATWTWGRKSVPLCDSCATYASKGGTLVIEGQPQSVQRPSKGAKLPKIVDPRKYETRPEYLTASFFKSDAPVVAAGEVAEMLQGAMIAAQRFEGADRLNLSLEEYKEVQADLAAWLELAEKLKRA